MSMMNVMDPSGHTSIEWTAGNAAEVTAAREMFDTMTGKGYQAFRIGARGQQAERITTFDPNVEKLMLIPQLKGG